MRQEKQYLQDAIVQPIDKHSAFVIMNYARVPANTVNQFRRNIAAIGGTVKMTRKRILMKAFQTAGIEFSLDQFPGHVGIVFSGADPIEGVKAAFQFVKEAGKNVSIIGGRIDGKVYSGNDVETLSKLPSKDEMRAQFLATLEAPMAQTLAVMEAVLSSVVYCLDNKCKLDAGSASEDVSASE
jgi:large subunit ribosomal protein L10